MRLDIYNGIQARWMSFANRVGPDSDEIMTIFNNTGYDLIYNLISPNGDVSIILYSGSFQKISRLGLEDVCVIHNIRLTRSDIREKLIFIESSRNQYRPNIGFVGSVERLVLSYLRPRAMHIYIE